MVYIFFWVKVEVGKRVNKHKTGNEIFMRLNVSLQTESRVLLRRKIIKKPYKLIISVRFYSFKYGQMQFISAPNF